MCQLRSDSLLSRDRGQATGAGPALTPPSSCDPHPLSLCLPHISSEASIPALVHSAVMRSLVITSILLTARVSSGGKGDEVTSRGVSLPMSRVLDDMFENFKSVELQAVWDEIQSRKVVSFSVVRDAAQFLVVQTAWVLAGLLLWRGPAVTRRDQKSGEESTEVLENKGLTEAVDVSKINSFFMNPQHVTRNLVVCSSLVSLPVYCGALPNQVASVHDHGQLLVPALPAVEEDSSHGLPNTRLPAL